MPLYGWSTTAATNATADATINWAEGQAPSSVNDSARAMMAQIAKWRDDNNGSLLTGGTSSAFTLTTNQGFTSKALMAGQKIAVQFHADNAASATLNVDGLGAAAIVSDPAFPVSIAAGTLNTFATYDMIYNNANTRWYLSGYYNHKNFAESDAIPAGGTAGLGLMVSTTANFGLFFGSGAPTLSAAKGSIYLRSDGSGTSDRMYVNTNGSTTWTAVTTAA